MRERKAPKITTHLRVKNVLLFSTRVLQSMFLKKKAQTDHETKSRKRSVHWQAQSAKEQCKEMFFCFFFNFLLYFTTNKQYTHTSRHQYALHTGFTVTAA